MVTLFFAALGMIFQEFFLFRKLYLCFNLASVTILSQSTNSYKPTITAYPTWNESDIGEEITATPWPASTTGMHSCINHSRLILN